MTPASNQPRSPRRKVCFGAFEVDLEAEELRKSGQKVKVYRQSFQILVLLLERPGEIVTRDELRRRLWPADTFVDFEHGLNAAVKRLRQALGDSADVPRFIETLYRRGYRFVAPLQQPVEGTPNAAAATEDASQVDRVAGLSPSILAGLNRHRNPLILISGTLILAVSVLYLWRPGALPPKVVRTVQITNDGRLTSDHGLPLVSDGSRIFFTEVVAERFVIAQVSAAGGDTVVVPTPFKNAFLYDISPNHAELLVLSLAPSDEASGLWILPVVGGAPRRLGAAGLGGGAWSPDGQHIVYCKGEDLYLVRTDGSETRKLVTATEKTWWPRWSPDGKRLRFTVGHPNTRRSSLWEIAADGSQLHPVFPGWNEPPTECCGNWTQDGKYFVFSSSKGGTSNIWLSQEPEDPLGRVGRIPVQVTTGPMSCTLPVPSKDGRNLFVVGVQRRGELVRYDVSSKQFQPYLGGMSADWVDFSKDRSWIAYCTFPDSKLWRSKVDGSDRLQLSLPPTQAIQPRWSPDGKQIAFVEARPGKSWRICLVSSEGGPSRAVAGNLGDEVDPDWSPDGESLIFGGLPPSLGTSSATAIRRLNLKSQQLSTLPDSEGLFTPRWSPDGRYLAALTSDSSNLMLFDFRSEKWERLARMSVSYLSWSRDSKHIYFDNYLDNEHGFYRVRVADRRLEQVVDLKDFKLAAGIYGSWSGLTPDGSPLLTRDVGTQDIYALELLRQ